ncbi:MAG: restriction endonuclease [Candidatus Altiarchaeota archaeon]
MVEQKDYISSEIDPYDFEKMISQFVAKMGFEVESLKRDRDGVVDVIAKSANPLGGSVLSLIRAKTSTEKIMESDVQKLFDDMKKMGAVRAAYVTTSDFAEEAHAYAAGKPLSLVNRYRLFESLSMSGVELEEDFVNLLDKYGLAEKYYQTEKHSFKIGKTLSEAKEYFAERLKKIPSHIIAKKDRGLRVEGRYTPVGVFLITDIDESRIKSAEKEGAMLHDEESLYVNLNNGELYYMLRGTPQKKGFLARKSEPPENELKTSTIIEDILLLPPESKSHLIDLLEHGDLPHEHLVGKHLSILEKRGVVHIYNLSDRKTTTRAQEIVGFIQSIIVLILDEFLDIFGSFTGGEGNGGTESKPQEKEEDRQVGAKVKMPHHVRGIYNLKEFIDVEEGLEEDFEFDQTRYRSKDIEQILKSIFWGEVHHKGVVYLPYYEGRFINQSLSRVIKREAYLAPKIKQAETQKRGDDFETTPKRKPIAGDFERRKSIIE